MEAPTSGAIDPGSVRDLRRLLGSVPTAVVVVAGCDRDGLPRGMTIGTFTSVSLDPPLVGFLPGRDSRTWKAVENSDHLGISVLGAHQAQAAAQLGGQGADRDLLTRWQRSVGGAPILEGAIAWLECVVHEVLPAGDHYFVLARVQAADVGTTGSPLIFHEGAYTSVPPGPR